MHSPHSNPITNGSLSKVVWQMSWPLLITSALSSTIGLTDMYFAGLISESAQAAVGIAEQVLFLSVLMGTGLSVGTSACIARHFGAGRYQLAYIYARDSLLAGAIIGILASLIGYMLSKPIFVLFGSGSEVSQLGVSYLQICALGNLPFISALILTAVFRAIGAPRYALYQWIIITLISIGGASALFYGLIPGCPLSIEALAWSWDAGSLVGDLFALFWLCKIWSRILKGEITTAVSSGSSPSVWQRLKEPLAIGLPTIVADAFWIASNFLMFGIFQALPHACQAQAAWSVAVKIEETFASMPLLALSLAAGVIAGQNLGAGQRERAWHGAWKIAIAGALFMLIVGLALWTSASSLTSWFTSDRLVADYSKFLLLGAPITLPLMAFWLILFGSMEGAGSTRTPMVINLIGLIAVRLPLTWLLAIPVHLGIVGVWLSVSFSRVLLSLAAIMAFKQEGWQKPVRAKVTLLPVT